jgi:hypothetical protein
MATKPSKGRKPGKDYYWNGQEWIWIQRTGKPKPTVKPQPPRRTTTVTTDQWAEKESNRIVEAQLAAIRDRENAWRTGLQEEAARRAQQAQKFAQMVQGMGLDKQIQGIFSNAGHDVAGFGSGFAGQTRQIADAAAAEMTNLLGGNAAGVRNEGEAMGNVTHGMGGFIPSASLAAQGAAFASDAAMQPGFMLQQGLQDSEKFLHEGLSDNPFLDLLMETKLSKHEIKENLKQQKVEINMKAQEQRLDQMEADRKYWLAMQAMYLDQKKYKLAAQAEKRAQQAQTRYDQEARGMTPDGEVAPGFYRDPKTGRIIENGYRADGTKIEKPESAANKKKGGLTANEQQAQLQDVYKAEPDIKDLAASLAKEYGWNPSAGPKANAKARNRIAAEIRKRYGWVTTTKSKKALAEIIGRVLGAMAKMGPPAPGTDTGTGSGLFD